MRKRNDKEGNRSSQIKNKSVRRPASIHDTTQPDESMTGVGNVIEKLKADHESVSELFRGYEAVSEKAYDKRNRIAEEIFATLDAHAKFEEDIFYPAVQALGDRKLKQLVSRSLKDDREVKTMIEDLRGSYPASEYYDIKFKMLKENVEHHVQEEEGKLFPGVEDKLSGRK